MIRVVRIVMHVLDPIKYLFLKLFIFLSQEQLFFFLGKNVSDSILEKQFCGKDN